MTSSSRRSSAPTCSTAASERLLGSGPVPAISPVGFFYDVGADPVATVTGARYLPARLVVRDAATDRLSARGDLPEWGLWPLSEGKSPVVVWSRNVVRSCRFVDGQQIVFFPGDDYLVNDLYFPGEAVVSLAQSMGLDNVVLASSEHVKLRRLGELLSYLSLLRRHLADLYLELRHPHRSKQVRSVSEDLEAGRAALSSEFGFSSPQVDFLVERASMWSSGRLDETRRQLELVAAIFD